MRRYGNFMHGHEHVQKNGQPTINLSYKNLFFFLLNDIYIFYINFLSNRLRKRLNNHNHNRLN